MRYKLKPIKPPERRGAITEYAVLGEDGDEIARVYRKETVKTGFKRRRCVGQVPCKAWFVKLINGSKEHGHVGDRSFGDPKWYSRDAALGALPSILAQQEQGDA